MSVLRIAPTHWYSWNFDVTDGGSRLAYIDVSNWRERATFRLDGAEHHLAREGMIGDFLVERAGSVVARAQKPSAFQRSFTIRHAEKPYTLRARSPFSRAFVLLDGDREIGSLVPDGPLTRRATATLPEPWPDALKVFTIWLAIILWKRQANSS